MTNEPKTRSSKSAAKPTEKTSKRSRSKKNKNKKGKRIFKKIMLALATLILIACVVGTLIVVKWCIEAPEVNAEDFQQGTEPTVIYDKNGDVYCEVGAKDQIYVEFEDIPKQFVDCLIAVEDKRFFEHHGVDPFRIMSAVVANLREGWGAEGASTITQQVIKNAYLTTDKTAKRKVQEMYMAIQLERQMSKEEIFEIYFNGVYMDNGIYGFATAADYYFGKTMEELTIAETAMLVGMPKAPGNYDPYDNPVDAEERKDVCLSVMYENGAITKEEMEEAQAYDITQSLVPEESHVDAETDDNATDAIMQQVIAEVDAAGYDVNSGGLQVYTSIDPAAQDLVEDVLDTDEYVDYPDDEMQAAVVLLDTQTGQVNAIGGSRHAEVAFGMNYATQSHRQPGSTIKPILDYAPAIEYLDYSTYTLYEDKKGYTYSDGTPVSNYGGYYYGTVTMRTALTKSLNVPAVQTIQAVGTEQAHEFAKGLGIELDETIYESASIGGVNNGPSPMELAGAYAAFGNEGVFNEPHVVQTIVVPDDEFDEDSEPTTIDLTPDPYVAMGEDTAYMITDMLRDVADSGTGTAGNISSIDMAAKTGTTNYTDEEIEANGFDDDDAPDQWYVGYTTEYTCAVWVGYDDRMTPVSTSNKYAANIYKAVMSSVSSGDVEGFKQPSSVVEVPIVVGSNPPVVASPTTPEDMVTYELFKKGTEPTEVTTEFDEPLKFTGASAKYNEATGQITVSWTYEQHEALDPAEFIVEYSVDGGAVQKTSPSTNTSIVFENVTPGATYNFTIKTADGKISTTTKCTVPKKQEVEPPPVEEEIPPVEGETPPTDGGDGTEEPPPVDGGTLPDEESNSLLRAPYLPGESASIQLTFKLSLL